MDRGTFDDILTNEGFREIGALRFSFELQVWWHDEHAIELLVMPMGSIALLKGSKSYVMKSISKDGATYVRDINQFCDYLESHFEEMHLSVSHFRDVSGTLAEQHVQNKRKIDAPTQLIPSPEDLAQIQREIEQHRALHRGSIDANRMMGPGGGLLGRYLKSEARSSKGQIERLKRDCTALRTRCEFFEKLQHSYRRKGSAALVSFAFHSNLQVVDDQCKVSDAVTHIVKELRDLDRYQVRQKLSGGKLRIQVDESREPLLDWIEQWFGGGMAPSQLERIQSLFPSFTNSVHHRCMVAPKEDVKVDGHVREHKKPLAQRAIASVLSRLDRTEDIHAAGQNTKSRFPLTIGRLVINGEVTTDPFRLPLDQCIHIYTSGTTGSGKSFTGRVIVEEAAQHKDLNILILDPRNQSAGLLVPEVREEILSKYDAFGMKTDCACGFNFEYTAPGQGIGNRQLALNRSCKGRQIVSFKGMPDGGRCGLFAEILEREFDRHSQSESDTPRLLIVVEEAHRFTKRRVDESAKKEAARAEITLDKIAREGRKFGICLLILSQTIRDFAYDAASIRQNTPTKIFMHNSDREVEYANDFIERGKDIVQLPPATAIIHNPRWGETTIRVRPPYSKVWEFSPDETREMIQGGTVRDNVVSTGARELLAVIRRAHASGLTPIKVGDLAVLSGISSKRKLTSSLAELESAGLISSVYLQERGKPRVIDLVSSSGPDGMRTEPDQKGRA